MIEYLNGVHEFVDYHGDFKVRVYMNDEYENYPQHWHPDAEIIMPLEGGYKVVVEGHTYELEPFDLLIIPPGELHELFAPPMGKRIILQFDGTMFHDLKGFNTIFHMYYPCVHIEKARMRGLSKELEEIIKKISREYFSSKPLREAAAYADLIQFFIILNRNYIGNNDALVSVKHQKQHQYIDEVFKVCQYMDNHFAEPIVIDDLAELVGFSKFHFLRIFKQVMHVTCYDYLIRRRLVEAKRLLTEPEMSITQVAMHSGFASLATFNRVFKAKNHCTPTEYKMYHRGY